MTEKRPMLIAIVVSILVTSILTGGLVFWSQNQKIDLKKQEIEDLEKLNEDLQKTSQKIDESETKIASTEKTTYKKISFLSNEINSLIPSNWSVFQSEENIGAKTLSDLPLVSISQDKVKFGDINWSQIDIFFTENNITEQLVQEEENLNKEANKGTWSKEKIGKIEADVITYPLDNNQATKEKTGGKKYFLTLENGLSAKTMVISKQAKGNQEFEDGFEKFIKSLEF
jgi:hypothetical protein